MSQLGTRKSRKGCRRCKQRRVKCDERAPCSNCIRRNEDCSLLEPSPSSRSDTSTEIGLQRTEEWIQDLELMHHFSTSIARGQFGVAEKVRSLWQDYIPKQALKHVFLMHGLLALSALHLAYVHPDEQIAYLRLCDKHQTIALKTFRELLAGKVSEELADALFALSSVISVSSMGRACAVNEEKTIEPSTVAEIFYLTRGVRDVLSLNQERIRLGPMVRLFPTREIPPDETVVLPPIVVQQFENIRHMLNTYGLDPEALKHCQEASDRLEQEYKNTAYFGRITNLEAGELFRWKVHVPTEYVRLVQARNPPALVILAYYAALFTALRTSWFTQNFAEYALKGISVELDESMLPWIEWPKQQLHDHMSVLGVVAPLQTHNTFPLPLID